jgi:cytochrome c peroxidase
MRSWLGVVASCFLIILSGCQPAMRYGPPPSRPAHTQAASAPTTEPAPKTPSAPAKPPPLPADFTWMESTPGQMETPVPIVFVHEGSDRAEWTKLTQFWNVEQKPPRPTHPVALLGGSPWTVAGVLVAGPADRVVKIKVPAGLDDPTAYLPPSNPPTLQKWELGKKLFFDRQQFFLVNSMGDNMSCASCHVPAQGFTSTRLYPRNAPTIINSVYNAFQFWDGRAAALEEVVQRTSEDERPSAGGKPEHRHVWGGLVGRLRASKEYVEQFKKAFGTPPTQDALGKALATYMRTVLSGNSLHDQAERAMKERGGKTLEARDYEKLLDDGIIKTLLAPDDPRPKGEVAKQLLQGYSLFHGKAGCVQCHGGRNFTDNGFHNIGEGDSAVTHPPGQEVGRFAYLPPGLKDRRMIGAYKTPSLRALPRTGPYFHDGLRLDLFDVVHFQVKPPQPGPHLDLEIRDRGLDELEKRALVVFLKALDGEAIAPIVADAAVEK